MTLLVVVLFRLLMLQSVVSDSCLAEVDCSPLVHVTAVAAFNPCLLYFIILLLLFIPLLSLPLGKAAVQIYLQIIYLLLLELFQLTLMSLSLTTCCRRCWSFGQERTSVTSDDGGTETGTK